MSYQLFKDDVLFYQRFLKSNGFYKDALDGIWGPKTDAADAAFVAQSKATASTYGTYDSRSESNIATLTPKAQIEARTFLKIASENQKDIRIISGTRTYDQQDKLYSQGRMGNPGPIVTNAKGGQSNHNFGIAWDIGLFESGKYITDNNEYIAFSKIVMPQMQSIEWGGDWTSIKDYPHYQLKAVSENIASVRTLFEEGETYA